MNSLVTIVILSVFVSWDYCLAADNEIDKVKKYYDGRSPAESGGGQHLKSGIGSTRYFVGGAMGTIIGFGTGHAIQKRFNERGYYYTISQGVAVASLVTGGFFTCGANISQDLNSPRCKSALDVSKGLFVVSKLIEVYDVWAYSGQNTSQRQEEAFSSAAFVLPTFDPSGAASIVAGLKWRF